MARLATVSRRGEPYISPVCYACDDESVYIASEPTTQKAHNIEDTGRASLVVDEFPDFWRNRAVIVRGRARILRGWG